MMLLCLVFSADGGSKSLRNVDACLTKLQGVTCQETVMLYYVSVVLKVLSHPLESVHFWLTRDILVTMSRGLLVSQVLSVFLFPHLST
jgi:hypothetical protein